MVKSALVVEDSDTNRLLYLQILVLLGFNTVTAETAQEAIELIETGFEPNLALIDMKLPDKKGSEVAEVLNLKVTKICFISSDDKNVYKQTLDAFKDAKFLTKPVLRGNLEATLKELGLIEE